MGRFSGIVSLPWGVSLFPTYHRDAKVRDRSWRFDGPERAESGRFHPEVVIFTIHPSGGAVLGGVFGAGCDLIR
jgi:hypothetical protein